MKQLDRLGQQLERGFAAIEAQTAAPARAFGLGIVLAVGVIAGGLAGLFVFLRLLTALF